MTVNIDRFLPTPPVETLTIKEVLFRLKINMQTANRDFAKYPNATRWTVQARSAFVYQQAFYFFGAVSRTQEEKIACLRALIEEPNGNWGDVICQHALGMPLAPALREYANCP